MARKKRKSFLKQQLLQLFENKNYQKVVSKIKQFSIEGMDEAEILKIHLNSLELLSKQYFEDGDIQRALRDVESAIDINSSPSLHLQRLKYLCYLERFKDAINYAKDLLEIKNLKIKKEIIFYYLLANIYHDNSIDKNYLKVLTKVTQNYILAILALFNNDDKLCLKYLDESNPRLKIEKENINSLKAIILNKSFETKQTLKPLYRFLLFGDDKYLQNSKGSRDIKSIVAKEFKQKNTNKAIQELIELKKPVDISVIKRQDDIRLVFNNIALLLDKKNSVNSGFELFTYYKDKLVIFPESIYLFIQIFTKFLDELENNQKLVQFLKKYLQLHKEKLPLFVLRYIFYTICTYTTNIQSKNIANQYMQLAKQYDMYPLYYMAKELSKVGDSYEQEPVEEFFSKFDKINEKILKDIALAMNSYDEISDFLDDGDKIMVAKRVGTISVTLEKIKNPDIKYKNCIFNLLDAISSNLLHFGINFYSKEYKNLNNCILKYSKLFEYKLDMLPQSIKNIFIKVKTNSDYIESEYNNNFDDEFDEFFEEDLEYEFGQIFSEFKMALKNGENPYKILIDFPKFYHWFFEPKYEAVVFDLISEYARFKTLTPKVIEKIFNLTKYQLDDEIVRKRLPAILNEFANHNYEISLKILEYLVSFKKSHETAWYMQWLYIYLDIAYKNGVKQNKIYKQIIARFVDIQKKKKYKTFDKKYEKVIERYKLKDIEYDGQYEQSNFDF